MTLEQFRILKAVVESGGVNAAAKKVHKTQPAISNAIHRLEAELGVSLFAREGYRLQLSADGEALYSQIDRILQNIETLQATAQHLATGNEPELKISMEVLTPITCMSAILLELGQQFPATRFSLSADVMRGALEKLVDGDVDIALGPKLIEQPDLLSVYICTIKTVPVAAPLYVQQPKGVVLKKSDMSTYTRIVIPENTKQNQTKKIVAPDGAREIFAADFTMKKQLSVAGLGWGFMPLHLVEAELAEGSLVQLDIADMLCQHIDIFAFRKSHRPMGPVLSSLWQCLAKK